MRPLPFFFYGTLLDGSDNPVAREVHRLLEPMGEAEAAGVLYAIPDEAGWFPALVAGQGAVHGRLYVPRAGFDAADLARLDAYEDFDPADLAGSLYVREEIGLESGGRAQVYRFNQPLPEGAQPIPGGDFRGWLAETGLAQFTGLREA
ncbi:gamma-glutamylcyclotransferase [Novosphingobium sp. MW5]|nr:gamma-glutamylcyclotransferase [Novosphingobium sp. MW5]